MTRFGALGCLAAASLAACSLQDFDRLERVPSAGAGGSAGSGAAGDTGATPEAGTGGSAGSGGDAGSAGAAGSTDEPGMGGASMDGGAVAPPPEASLVNPSFEQGFAGWSADPPSVEGTYATVQWPTPGATTPDGLNKVGTWSDSTAFTASIFQTVSGLADGRYTFKGNFNFGAGHNAVYLFARNCGRDDRQLDVPQTSPSQWLAVELTDIDVVGGQCDVGFFVDANPSNWLNADLFSLDLAAE